MSVCRLCFPNNVNQWAKTTCGSESCLARLNNSVADILARLDGKSRPVKEYGIWGVIAESLADGEVTVVETADDVSALRLACKRRGFNISSNQDKNSSSAKIICKRMP